MRASRLGFAILAAALAAGCASERHADPLDPAEPPAPVTIAPVSAQRSSQGRWGYALEWNGRSQTPGAVQVTLRWDANVARYAGQVPTDGTLVLVNDERAAEGVLRVLALDPRGLPARFASLAFEGERAPSVEVIPEDAVLLDLSSVPLRVGAAAASSDLPEAAAARKISADEWPALLEPDAPSGPLRSPNLSNRFGDATQDGLLNSSDVLFAARTSVGLAECFIGSATRDCIAANVAPFNVPGLGEPTDSCPPGTDVCGTVTRTVNSSDALAISRESVGIDQPVVGETIPRSIVLSTVTLSGVLSGSRTLTADTVYVLNGPVTVGSDAGAAGELTLDAGARLEGNGITGALVVSRNGRLIVRGTERNPAIMSCHSGSGPGCWRGLVIDGNATVNTGPASDPTPRSAGGCHQLGGGDDGLFGNCADADSSGAISWLQVRDAGSSGNASVELRALGSATRISEVYVLDSGGDGVRTRGGVVDLKYVRVIRPQGTGISWDDGWRGRLQFAVVQAGAGTDQGLAGSNSATDFNALPRSAPKLRNVSLIGPADPASSPASAGSIQLTHGTAGELVSFLFFAQATPEAFILDVDDAATFTQLTSGALRVDSSLIAGYARLGDLDTDPPVVGYDAPDVEGQYLRGPGRGHAIVSTFVQRDSLVKGPWTDLPDLRLMPFASLPLTPCPALGLPFFEAVTYCGAVSSANPSGLIPWFEPAPLVPFMKVPWNPLPALLNISVVSNPGQVPLRGVLLSGSTDGVTGADGVYRSYVPTAGGGAAFTVSQLPAGCSAEGVYFFLNLMPLEERSTGILVQC